MMAFERQGLGKRVVHARDGVEAMHYLLCRGSFGQRAPGAPMLDGFVVLKKSALLTDLPRFRWWYSPRPTSRGIAAAPMNWAACPRRPQAEQPTPTPVP